MKAKGSVLKYGDNVDTDVIIPARYLNSYDAKELASHAMVDIDPTFVERLNPGDIVVGGKNFGCGSSREHAPLALKTAGVSCVILECEEAAEDIDEGNQVEIDFDKGIIYNLTKNHQYKAEPFPEFMQKIIASGGLVEYVNDNKKN